VPKDSIIARARDAAPVVRTLSHFFLSIPMASVIPSEKELLEAACHFGHPREKWNPKIAPYLFGERKGIHIFNLLKTREGLEKVCENLQTLQAGGKTILFVSTKQQSIPFIEELGRAINQPVVTKKWIPGLLTNWPTIKKRIQYYLDLKRSFQTGEVEKYTKKEQTELRKSLAKLEIALSGVAGMKGLPDALFVIDGVRDHVAVLEAKKLGIPVFGICDSNANPHEYTALIPGNDDAVRSIALILKTVRDAVLSAKAEGEKTAA
jgi:small subunit ribosomal protein S2